MNIKKVKLSSPDYPERLRQIDSPPKALYHAGASLVELLKRPTVAIVGTRKISTYGRQATTDLARRLAEQGVVIVSGLALGVDATAHRAALEAGGLAIGVLPSPLEKIVPATNRRLANQIIENGGALVSEYEAGLPPFKQYFIARNRIMSGLADAVLITEAGAKSGALYTAEFANKQGREVLAVPNNIYQVGSIGVNNLIKTGQAGLVTGYKDILHALGLNDHKTPARAVKGRNRHEQTVLDLLLEGVSAGDELLQQSNLSTSEFNQVLTMLEIGGKIRPLGANNWSIY
jgi:DNA processing protein